MQHPDFASREVREERKDWWFNAGYPSMAMRVDAKLASFADQTILNLDGTKAIGPPNRAIEGGRRCASEAHRAETSLQTI